MYIDYVNKLDLYFALQQRHCSISLPLIV